MIPDAPTDAELLARFRRQTDRGALSLLFERHRGLAYRVALGVVRNAADAEDAVQDAFLNLLAYEPRVRPEASLAGLVARMALRAGQRLARSAGRRRTREAAWALPEDATVDAPFDHVAERETRRAVRQAVDALDDRYRLPVLLHYVEGLSTQETAEALGISRTAVTTRLSRAVGKLRDHLKREGVVVAAPALAALLPGEGAQAAPASLAARLESLAASAPAGVTTAAGMAAGVSAAPLLGKAAVAAFVVAVSLGGAATVRRLPPPPPAGATTPTVAPPQAIVSAPARPTPQPPVGVDRVSTPAPRAHTRVGVDRVSTRAASTDPRVGVDRVSTRATHQPSLNTTPPRAAALPVSPSPHPPVSGGRAAPRIAQGPEEHPAEPAARRILTREEELRLAADICVEAWEEERQAGRSGEPFLGPLAKADPERAQALVDAAPADQQEGLRQRLLQALGQENPPQASELLAREKVDPRDLLTAARELARADKGGATALLDRAVEVLRKRPVTPDTAAGLASAACVAREMGDARVPELVAEVERMGPEVLRQSTAQNRPERRDDWWWGCRYVTQSLGLADIDAALRLVAQVPVESDRERIAAYVIHYSVRDGILRQDPARALALLDAHRPGPSVYNLGEHMWCRAMRRAALALAAGDPDRAAAAARQIPDAGTRAGTLTELAEIVPTAQAASLRREAIEFARAADPLQGSAIAARVAQLLPHGPRRREACALALEQCTTPGGEDDPYDAIPHVAFALAPMDREGARALLEDAEAIRRRGTEAPRQRAVIAAAFAAVDPVCAVEVARTIPDAGPRSRSTALLRIAQYLVADPAVRAGFPFQEWAVYGTWIPGEREDEW